MLYSCMERICVMRTQRTARRKQNNFFLDATPTPKPSIHYVTCHHLIARPQPPPQPKCVWFYVFGFFCFLFVSFGSDGEYDGEVGLYDGEVGEYDGLVGE